MCPCPSAWETEPPGQEGRGQPEGPQEVEGRPPRAGPGSVSAEPMRCVLGWAIGGGREQVKAGKMSAQLAGTSRAKVWKPGGGGGREVPEGGDICVLMADSGRVQKRTQHCTAVILQLKKKW